MDELNQSVAWLKGVGPKKSEVLNSLGIKTVYDLLTYYPFRYDDIQEKSLDEIQDQEKVVLKGTVLAEPVVSYYGFKKSRLVFRMMTEQAVIGVTFFNQPFLKSKINASEEIAIYGKWDGRRKALTGMKVLATQEEELDFSPIYHVNKQIRQKTLVDLIKQTWELYGHLLPENLPEWLTSKYRLMPKRQAAYAMHFPETIEENRLAKRRLAFEEFFLFQLKMIQLKKQETSKDLGKSIMYDVKVLKEFIRTLPFELTGAQKKVVNEICGDLRSQEHMHRLLQGDVGSGKTIVAAIALYAVVSEGLQGALMVPTEILAEQHMESLTDVFSKTDVKVGLLTSSTKTAERRQILADLASGEMDIIVGTHSLIQDDIIFNDLSLAIIDEQHRFGVNQRKALREKGNQADVLFMTATPIPRTLAITAYGEMDVSIIDELPAGRIPIETRWILPKQVDSVLTWLNSQLKNGQQVYVICPLIEESEMLDVKNAIEIYEHLKQFFEPNFKVGLLHGKMKSQEKDEIMTEFKDNDMQILVSTTVIEVGVNVPNATTMMIMDADRFGLAQLHQLRGRVGRGSLASYCILVASPKSDQGKERMKIMTETTDGFVLSQKDLEMRGPGDFFGSKQSGLPEFKVGDIVADEMILETARVEATQLIETDDWMNDPANAGLVTSLNERREESEFFD
ncbi:ATP-dependent DNA helicase RecG [Vagococcus fluvialis]|uniref:ATP-dependent DNA helicase RecG n=1 Tax=Vagococcus fluvialis TaxID=2738 RepID=UPI001A8DFAD7|nr:ATP-dependent DNA helicase RecG [Vagococcus fluvialis]MBO0480199.1 ATP-dependent DNA helicase RecG [Vagococcus fluvialis]MBO0483756.1 ATP-dependent DNA helicase RecG [Vagococcus fluvialis]UDM71028.1 ATP-dependent DNA helicase RecG [Vagococcus fluvialis]UDM75886.1 ATP-dependent DNA helicase RecG [Vagococcus fluvialis]UDM82716.1 ATP-dependent DNA helicase RecG [Vagococcus fluvialis]